MRWLGILIKTVTFVQVAARVELSYGIWMTSKKINPKMMKVAITNQHLHTMLVLLLETCSGARLKITGSL